jgi:hypothetical protein
MTIEPTSDLGGNFSPSEPPGLQDIWEKATPQQRLEALAMKPKSPEETSRMIETAHRLWPTDPNLARTYLLRVQAFDVQC